MGGDSICLSVRLSVTLYIVHYTHAVFLQKCTLLTTLHVNSLFCLHINDIVNEFGVHCSHLIIIFLPFRSQFLSNIVTKLSHILAILLPFLLPFCNKFLPDIATVFDQLYYRLAIVFLPFCSQFVSDIVIKFGAHVTCFTVLLPSYKQFCLTLRSTW